MKRFEKEIKGMPSFKRVPLGWWFLVQRSEKQTKLHFFKGEDIYHTCYCNNRDFDEFETGWKYNEFTHFRSWFKGHGIKHIYSNFKTYSNDRNYRIFLNKLIQYKKADLRRNLSICIIDEI